MKRDPYEILGLERGAPPEAIRRAYRQLARRHHPDLNPHRKDAAERFREIADAYQRLIEDPAEPEIKAPPRRPPRPAPRASREGGGRAPRSSTPPSEARYSGTEAEYLVRAHIHGLRAGHLGAILGAIAACVSMTLLRGQSSTVSILGASVVAFFAALATSRVCLVAQGKLESDSEVVEFVARLVPTAMAIFAALGILVYFANGYFEARSSWAGACGGMACAYLIGRTWNPEAWASSLILGIFLGAVAGGFVTVGMNLFGGSGRYRIPAMNPDVFFAGLIAAIVGGILGGLFALFRRSKARRSAT